MIADLKPYPKLKDSRVQWLGEVPGHWEVSKIKSLARPGYKTFVDGDWIESPYITPDGIRLIQTGNIGTGEYREKGFRYISEETFKNFCCTEVEPDDILICRLGEPVARTCLAPRIGKRMITSVDVCILKPRAEANAKFFVYSMSSRRYLDWVGSLVRGSTRDRVSRSMLGSFAVPVPPPLEQTAIVRFLDDADRRIRRYIRAKQKLIGLLEEQKQAIIREAVTGQIDVSTGRPYPAYKDSGVRWLGKVPEHWEVVQLRRVAVDRCDGPFGSGLKSLHYTRHGIRVVRLQNIGHGEFKSSDVACISPEHYSSLGDHSVMPGDILVAGLGDDNHPAGRACVAPENIAPAMVKADCFRFRPDRHRVEPRFVALQLTSTAATASALLSTGATRQRTNLQSTSSRAITIPTIHEQSLVVEYSALETSTIRSAQETAIKEMVYLREYRTRLTADVVTGKLDVREAAARLPEADPLEDEVVVEAVNIDVDSNPEEREAAQEVSL